MFVLDDRLLVGFEQFDFTKFAFGDVDGLSNDPTGLSVFISQDDSAIVKIAITTILVTDAVFSFQGVVRQPVEMFDRFVFGNPEIVRVGQRFPGFPGSGDLARLITQYLAEIFAAHD